MMDISEVLKPNNVKETEEGDIEPELESLPKDITEKVDVAQKLDLFKSVFLSSSESEDEEKTDIDKIEELKANVLSESLIPKIKPIKEGILSNVNFHTFSNPKKIIQEQTEREEQTPTTSNSTEIKKEVDVVSYGPALPNKRSDITSVTKVTFVVSDSEDEWVEKSEDNKRTKHKKKHKKEKHKKHKREKKKTRNEK